MKRLNGKELAAVLEARAAQDLELCNIAAASVLVMQEGEVLYKNHFYAKGSCWDRIGDRTLFRLASMTKPITGVATMLLVEKGLLSLEDTVDRFYPEFASLQILNEDGSLSKSSKKITVRDLLTHSSGIASGHASSFSDKLITPKDRESVENFVTFLSRQPLSFEPQSKQEYSGVGAFSVLTGIIQKLSGMSYEAFLKKEIFAPCRMSDTTFLPTAAQWERLIPMHSRAEGKHKLGKTLPGCVFCEFPAENYLGGAGLISSLEDYTNFAKMLAQGGVFEGERVLSEESVTQIRTPCVYKKETESWGLGVRVITQNGVLPSGTFGWSGAFGTHFWIDPSNRIVALYMKNSHYDGGSGATTARNFEKDVYAALQGEL